MKSLGKNQACYTEAQMELRVIFAALSSLLGISAFSPYIRDIFQRKTEPHSYSWLIWSLLQTIAVIAMLRGGAGLGVAALAAGALLCAGVFILSLRYGTRNITSFDTVCPLGALIAISIYVFLRNALLSVWIVVLTDLIGFLTNMEKVIRGTSDRNGKNVLLERISQRYFLSSINHF